MLYPIELRVLAKTHIKRCCGKVEPSEVIVNDESKAIEGANNQTSMGFLLLARRLSRAGLAAGAHLWRAKFDN